MTGQNTEKQILAMVLLLVLAVASLGAYTWYDNGRRIEATSEVFERDSERGAHTFARNCRVCHGNDGRGTQSHSGLVGPALNTPANTYAWRTDNVGQLETLQVHFRGTITCGRNGTAMPPWSIDEGGSLNSFQIDNLVTLISTNAGGAWEVALHSAIEEDEQSIANLEVGVEAAAEQLRLSGWSPDVEAAMRAVELAESADVDLTRARAAVAAAEASGEGLTEASDVLTALERAYFNLASSAIGVRILDPEESAEQFTLAQRFMSDASPVQRDLAEQRGWLRLANNLRNAQENLAEAEERFANGLPISLPPAQVTQGTCGQAGGSLHGAAVPGGDADVFTNWLRALDRAG